MYKNYINLENFNHKLVVIFLEDGKVASSTPREWRDGSISCDHMISPKGLSNGTQRNVT
jgi:hypothetical protein